MINEEKQRFKEILKLCTWHYKGYCMADSGEWGQVPCNGDCTWPQEHRKLIKEKK